jgi:hypothetical protein
MRYVCLAAAVSGLLVLIPGPVFGQGQSQGFSITNYQYVSEQRISQFQSYVTYRADLVNTGPSRIAMTASVTSLVPSVQVMPGQGNLHFAPVPANRTVTSLDTFTILVDRSVTFDFANLQWSFLSPVANAGANQSAKVGDKVTLNGSGSTNPSGFGTLTYNWKFTSVPPGSSTVLFWYDTVQPNFTVDVPGNYVITLTVSNGAGSDAATVTVSTTNTPPVANAGPNRTVAPGTTVTLNGSGSSDVDGDPLTYSWILSSRPSGSNATLIAPNTASPVFTVDKAGTYTATLVVNDGKVNSAPSVVTITTQNTPPVANAGPNQVKAVGSLVQLDGSGSTDVDGDPLTYSWTLVTLPQGSTATLSSATAVKPTFTADRQGTYVAQLIVNDGIASSAAATVQITTNPPLAPTANAGPNQTVPRRTMVHLSGAGTDPQGLPLTFQWSLTTKPPLSTAVLSSTTAVNPDFVADMPGNYVAQLIVSNGSLSSAPSTVTITTTNTAPVANPGQNQFVPVASSVLLDGTGSTDADNDPLTYAWSFTSRPAGSTASLSSTTAVSPTFFADLAGTYVVQLIVSDGFASSNPVTATITAGVNTITLTPNPLNLATNTPGILTVNLGSAAGPGGQIVSLNSSNGNIAAIQANVTVPAGQAGVNVTVTPGSGTGSTIITAAASGFTPGSATVNVTIPAITVALSSGTVGLTRTATGTLTLSTPAPTGGVTVSLTSNPSGIVSFQPVAVPFAAGATTGSFTMTGDVLGSATVIAGGPGYNTGSAGVTVAMLGAINLPANVTVGPGQTASFPVSLATGAPAGGVVITLASSNTSKVTISPATVTIDQGQTTPAQQPTITGVNLGSADISASAPGFFGDTKTVQVSATLSFQQQNLTIGVGATQNLTLNLSGTAPANGLTVNVSSSNTGAATVPTTVTFAPNSTSVAVPVTGVGVGTAVIHASGLPALADTTATVNVVNLGGIVLPSNATVGLGLSVPFQVTLPAPAPAGGVTITLTSSDTSKLTISPGIVTIGTGQTGPPAQPQITGVNVGTANITASATGYTSSTQPVQVTATLSFAQPSITINGAATQNVALTLSAPPPGGLTVNLTSSNPGVATVPLTAIFPANATTVNVPITGVGPGSAVIHASATNVPDATTSVTVQSAGTINVPANVSTQLGLSAPLAISLSAAPSSPVTVTLTSTDPTKVGVSTNTVTIAAGQTSPATQPQVTGLNIGTASVNVTAPGYTSGSTSVQVGATINFAQPTLTITGTATQNITLNLSAAAPAGGLTVNLSSSNTGVATVPPSVSFAQGSTAVSVPVTGVASGSAVIHASNLPSVPDVTANVTVQILGTISLPSNTSISLGQTATYPVTLSAPAPAPVTVALFSSDTSKVTISAASVSIAQGATTPAQQPTITGVNLGSANINASATGYNSASGAVQVSATISFTPPTVTFTGGGTQNLTLTLSGQAPSGGLTVDLSSNNTAVATVPATATFVQGQTTVQVPVTIVASGTTVIHASKLPGLADTTANVTVQGDIGLPANVTVAPGQQASFAVTLSTPAPAGGINVSLSSSDPSKVSVVFASVFINQGQTTPSFTPRVSGVDFGSATITATANGYGSSTAVVQVTGSVSFFPPTLTVVSGSGTQNFSLSLSVQAPSAITFNLTSSNTGVATVPATVTIPANQNNVNVPATLVGTGSTTITASTSTPNIANTTGTLTVTAPGAITLPASPGVGLGKSVPFPVNLGAPAASNVTVTLGSSNTSKLTISPATVTIAAGQTAPASQPTITGVDIGGVTITASAPGYTTANVGAQVTATITYAPPTLTIVGATQDSFVISLSGAAPPSGITLTLSSSNTGVATVPPQQTFFPDGSSISTLVIPVTGIAAGTAVIHAGAPPYIPDTTATVTVLSPGTISIPTGVTLAANQAATFAVTLGTAAPTGGVTVNLASSDTSKVTISQPSVTIAQGQTAPATQPTVTGVNYGSANITASAPGYTSATRAVTVTTTMSFASPTVTINGLVTQNIALNLSSGAPTAGLTVNLTSSSTGVATVPASVIFASGATTVNLPVTTLAVGSTTITASTTAPGIANATTAVTVQSPGAIILPPSGGLGLGQTVTFPVTLSSPAASPVTIALASSDPSRVSISAPSVTIAAGQTAPPTQPTVTAVNLGAANINATATGFAPATSAVQVTATVGFTQPNVTMTGAGTQNLTLNLSAAAAATGIVINLSSTNTGVATVPSTVTFNAGLSSVSVPVTAVGPGSTVIHASNLPNIADATANVTVQGGITLPNNVTVPPGQQVPFPITLAIPAPVGGVTVNLSSSDTSKVTLVSGSVFISQGQTAPAAAPTINGINFGSATITATATGYGSSNATVQVTGSASFFPPSVSILSGSGPQNLSLTLSVQAPTNVTFTLTSSNPSFATVPPSVTIPANQNNVTVAVTPVAAGTVTITASTATPNIADATATVTVTSAGSISLPSNANVGLSASVDFPVTLGTPAPTGGVTVTLSSGAPGQLSISPPTVTIPAGQTTPATQPKVTGLDVGNVNVTASAPGYTAATVQAQVTATLSYAPPSLTIVGNTTQNFVVTLSGNAPASGIPVTISSSNPAAATVASTMTFFPGGGSNSTITLPVTAVAPGATTIHVGAPPFIPDTTATVNVLSPGTIGLPPDVTVGPTQSAPFPVTLGTPAPSGGVIVTLASSDTTKLTISAPSVTILQGQTTPAVQPTVTGVNYGTANINATAPGYTSASAPVQVTATMTFASPTVTIGGIATQNVALNLSAPAPAGGLTVNLNSSNTGVATVPASVNFPANAVTLNVPITAVSLGSTTITATAVAPGIANATTNVTVQSAGAITMPANATVGLTQSATLAVSLSQAPSSNVTIALSSTNPSKVTITPASVTILANQTTPGAQPTITGVTLGSANITATLAGYTSGTTAVQVNSTVNFSGGLTILTGSGPQNLTLNLAVSAPAGGVTVNLSSSNTSVATVPATVTFNQGQSSVSVPVTPITTGTAVIHASSLPNISDATANVTVTAPVVLSLPANPTVGLAKTVAFPVSLTAPTPSDVTIALASSDTSKLTVSPASITILAGQSAPATQPTITGVNLGSASINASGTGVTPSSVVVQVNASLSFTPPTATITGIATQNLTLTLSGAAPLGGLTVNLSSSNTGVATVPASVNFTAGATTVNVPVTAVALGTATITASTLAPNVPNTTAAITVASAGPVGVPSNPTVGLGQTVPFAIALPLAAPSNLNVSLSSSDTSMLTVSAATVQILAGQTTPTTQPTITGLKPGSANITASAPGYTTSVASAQVNATVNFTPPTATISGFVTQNLVLTLSAAAPVGGVTINLSSSAPAVATVPATVKFNAGATTVNVPVTGVSFGSTIITAGALPNIANATANVTVQSAGLIGVPSSASVSLGQSATFAITLPANAQSPVTVTVVSSDPTKVAVSAGPFTIPQGATTPTTQPQITGLNIGNVTITASAAGYTSNTSAVQTTAVVQFSQPTVTITGIVTQNLTLTLSAPAPSGGLTVNLSSSNTAIATVPGTATFAQGGTTANVPVTTVALGTAVIHASAAPFIADAITTVTAQSAGNVVVPATVPLTLGQQSAFNVTLSAPAPAALNVSLASSDTSKVTITPPTVAIAQGATAPLTQPTVTGVSIGSANITASAPAYTTGTAAAQVTATVNFSQASTTITGLNTQNLTLNLSAAAPTGGLTVNISSSNTSVATVPATVNFAAGATTATVTVTAVALGTTVIHANALPSIPDATSNVTVVTAGPISLPSGVTAALGGSAPFAVTLPVAAPANGVTVTLTSADPTKVTVTPAAVSIAAGQKTPASQPVVNGVNVGSASVSAAAPGYTTSSQTVNVGATVAWPGSNITLTSFGMQNITLTLSAAAPAAGVTVNLSSSNTLVATVPSTATFPGGSNTVSVPVNAISEGTAVFHANGLNIPDAPANVTVAIPTLGSFTVNNVTVGQNLQQQLLVTLSNPVPVATDVTLTSSDPSKLVLGSLVVQGTGTTLLKFPAGSSNGIVYAQALAGSGQVTVTASAAGYTSGSGTVTLTPSGFVITGPTGVVGVASFPTNIGNTTTLTIMTGRLDASLQYVENQQLRGGFSVSVPLTSSNQAVGRVSPASVTFTPADTAYTTTFSALAVGGTLVSATVPAGFSLPASGGNSITANVATGGLTAPSLAVGNGLEKVGQVTLTGAPGSDQILTITSNDPSRLLFSVGPAAAGASSLPLANCAANDFTCKVVVRAGQNHSADFYIHALDSTGTATYTVSMTGFPLATGTVTFQPSGILIQGPSGLGNVITTTTGSAPTTLTVESAMLDPVQHTMVELQLVASNPGSPAVQVNVTSSNTNFGTITASPVTIPAGSAATTTSFQPVANGQTTISASVPTGFIAPATYGSVLATVGTPGISVTDQVSIGKNLQISGNFTLGAFAPPGLIVTITSSDPSLLRLSTSPTAAGSTFITISMPPGGFGGSYYLQALGNSGTVQYTASAPGYTSRTGTITLTPSGVVLGDGINPGGFVFGNIVVASMAQLDLSGNFVEIQQLAGGMPTVLIDMSTTVGGASITTPVQITGGNDSVNAVLTGSGFGSVTASTPTGYSTSNFQTVSIFF